MEHNWTPLDLRIILDQLIKIVEITWADSWFGPTDQIVHKGIYILHLPFCILHLQKELNWQKKPFSMHPHFGIAIPK